MDQIRIILADDHDILRDGLCALIRLESGMTVVGEAKNGRSAVDLTCQLEPDLVIMDINMPFLNGLEATRQIRRQCPNVKVLILSMYDGEEYVRGAVEAGAIGFLLKDSPADEVINAIRVVTREKVVFYPSLTRLFSGSHKKADESIRVDLQVEFNPLEVEVLKLLAERFDDNQIARKLNISNTAVLVQCTNLMLKLNLHNRGELVEFAGRNKSIDNKSML